jgi:hypothetical protein
MTIAVIVACKDSFYIIADTLASDQVKEYWTNNTRKVFFSEVHKIGMCIAGQGALTHKNETKPAVIVSSVVRDFFKYIDDEYDIIDINYIGRLLIKFVDDYFQDYNNYFEFQNPGNKHDNDISYFYGGFKDNLDESVSTIIHSHHKGKDDVYEYTDLDSKPCFFANTDEFGGQINDYLKENPDYTAKILLNHPRHVANLIIGSIIPRASINLNIQQPYSVGNFCHYIRILSNEDQMKNCFFEWSATLQENFKDKFEVIDIKPSFPSLKDFAYAQHRTIRDEIQDKTLKKYNCTGQEVTLTEEHIESKSDSLLIHSVHSSQAAESKEEKDSGSDNALKESSDNSGGDSKPTATEASSCGDQKIESLSIIANEESDKSNSVIETKTENDPEYNELLNHLLSWIYQLPQWLQDQILQSTPVKALIESIEQAAAIHDKKFVVDLFVDIESSEPVSDSSNSVENNMQEGVMLLEKPSEGSIDMSMIYKESTVTGWILPTLAIIGSGNIFGDSAFGGLPMNFNGLNGIEGF